MGSRVVIVTHVFATGPAQELRDYLCKKVSLLLFIGHPLFYQKGKKGSYFILFRKGKLLREKVTPNFRYPAIFSYLKDFFLTIFWVIRSGEKWDLYVGVDNLNALSGIILRKLGRVKKAVFYTVDYVPERFKNRFLNELYHWVDKISLKHSDLVWNLSPRMAQGREKVRGLKRQFLAPQIVVPMGAHIKRIKKVPFEQIKRNTLVFMGHLTEKQGVQLVLRAIPRILKSIPRFKFLVIGTGEYEGELKLLARRLGIEKHVKFAGFVKDHAKIEKMISRCGVAVAPYNKRKDKFTYYADPAKIKVYLGAGLPIVLTDVPHIGREIEKRKAGMVVDYDEEDLASAVTNLLSDEERLREYRESAFSFGKEFDWNKIFEEALGSIDD